MKNLMFNKIRYLFEKHPLLFFGLAAVVQYREILFFNKKIGWDTLDAIFPHFLFMVDAFKSWTLPYYNPLIQGGFSFGENFFTAFLLNPIDILLAIVSTVLPPLFVFQLQFPVFAAFSGYWFFKFLYKINNEKTYAMLGGFCYFSSMLFPVAGQSPFFYAFVLLAFLLFPFPRLIERKGLLVTLVALVVLITLIIKAYYFFIPFFLVIGFVVNWHYYKLSFWKIFLLFAIASLVYLAITFPVFLYLKASLSDLNGSFVSPEPRLRSLVPEEVFYHSSITNVIADIIDNRILRGGGFTRGFNVGLVFLFFIQMFLFLKKREKVKEKSLFLILILLSMYCAKGSFSSIHNMIPLIKSFRWGFSYVHFSQIFFLFFVFFYPIRLENLTKNDKVVAAISFALFFGWIVLNAENLKYLVMILPVVWLLFIFLKKSKWLISSLFLLCIAFMFKGVDFNKIPDRGERQQISDRKIELKLYENYRDPGAQGDYQWESREWLYSKKPSLNGYNNSIHPIFWYLKSFPETTQIVIPLCSQEEIRIKSRSEYSKNDNKYLEEYRHDLINIIRNSKCSNQIERIYFTMSQLNFQTKSNTTLVLQNMNPFSLVTSNQIKERILPGGIRLISGPKDVTLAYEFPKKIWTKNIIFNLLCFLILASYLLKIAFNRLRKGV